MLLVDWLNGWSRPVTSRRGRLSRFRNVPLPAEVEQLEDRCLLATFTVLNLNDSGADSLRAAVTNANNTPGADVINFSDALLNTPTRTIGLTSGQLTITDSVAIMGPGFSPDGILISGTGNSRVFSVANNVPNVSFTYLTITQGNAGSGDGGGLANNGTNTLVNYVVFSNNSTNGRGGAITNTGGLEIQRSQILGNTAVNGGGGVDHLLGTLFINDSTISNNATTGSIDGGGGVLNETSQLRISGSTISNNSATSSLGGGIYNISTNSNALSIGNSTLVGNLSAGGGGIRSDAGTVTLTNLTVVGNLDTSGDSNAAGGLSRSAGTVNSTNAVFAQNLAPNGSDNVNSGGINGADNNNMTGGNPGLGPLQDNGGPTFTMLPLPGSSLIDAGTNAGASLTDQRGYARRIDGDGTGTAGADIGGAEFHPTLVQPFLTSPGINQIGLNRAFNANGGGRSRFERSAYDGLPLEVRSALADVTGDGIKDIITGTGPGGGHVRIFDGATFLPTVEIFPFGVGFTLGVFVAGGDVTGDGRAEVIVGSDVGSDPFVVILDGVTGQRIGAFAAFDFAFKGGVRVASGDVNGDGVADIIAGTGPGSSAVNFWSGPNFNAPTLLQTLLPYNAFGGGVYVASGDVDGDGRDDLVTGAGAGGGPHVRVFSLGTGANNINLFPYAINFPGGVRVGTADINGDSFSDIITGAGPGGGPHVRIFSPVTQQEILGFFAYDISYTGGVYVAGSNVSAAGGSPLLLADDALLPQGAVPQATTEDLAAVTQAAIARFAEAGVNEAGIAQLQHVTVEVADLEGDQLALAFFGLILIDRDAAGRGFFVDLTPGDDLEFQTATGQALAAEAQGRVDLLTVISHELGHLLGLEHTDNEDPSSLMAERLAPGVRRTFSEDDLAALDSAFQSDRLQESLP